MTEEAETARQKTPSAMAHEPTATVEAATAHEAHVVIAVAGGQTIGIARARL